MSLTPCWQGVRHASESKNRFLFSVSRRGRGQDIGTGGLAGAHACGPVQSSGLLASLSVTLGTVLQMNDGGLDVAMSEQALDGLKVVVGK